MSGCQARPRLYRLSPWLVRALIPSGLIGSYVLYSHTDAGVRIQYVGRSDTDLRRRLVSHASRRLAAYFDYAVQHSAEHAYVMECASFHALARRITNRVHPARPRGVRSPCPFCRHVAQRIRTERLTFATLTMRGRS
jgi:hypothetical protein